ncbi:hypothetical protein PQR29_06305 [Paraburkholderia strydomiana]|jgi:hypothetical protein|uniref:hypothetical protein n=1 Tax=Paraburkholderia strydomiana TaxID=1245417 RepID=UPI0038B7351C
MGNQISAKNLDLVNEPRRQKNIEQIEESLNSLTRRGVKFSHYGKLVAEVSTTTGIHRTNLSPRRNKKYAGMILLHFISQDGGLEELAPDGAPAPALLLKIRQLEIDKRTLKRELDETRRGLRHALSQNTVTGGVDPDGQEETSERTAQIEHVNLCMLLTLIVDRFEGILALDFKSKTLVDESASPDQRIIAGPPRTTKFFSWAAGHRSNIESLRVIQSLVDPTRRFRNQ